MKNDIKDKIIITILAIIAVGINVIISLFIVNHFKLNYDIGDIKGISLGVTIIIIVIIILCIKCYERLKKRLLIKKDKN